MFFVGLDLEEELLFWEGSDRGRPCRCSDEELFDMSGFLYLVAVDLGAFLGCFFLSWRSSSSNAANMSAIMSRGVFAKGSECAHRSGRRWMCKARYMVISAVVVAVS